MSQYLADTHAILWFAAGQTALLGRTARRAFEGLKLGRTVIAVSVVTLWEVALLHDEDALRLPAGYSAWCDALEGHPGLRVEPLLRGDVEEARGLPALKDPHDRLIAGTAIRLGLPLLTRDRRIRASGLRTLW